MDVQWLQKAKGLRIWIPTWRFFDVQEEDLIFEVLVGEVWYPGSYSGSELPPKKGGWYRILFNPAGLNSLIQFNLLHRAANEWSEQESLEVFSRHPTYFYLRNWAERVARQVMADTSPHPAKMRLPSGLSRSSGDFQFRIRSVRSANEHGTLKNQITEERMRSLVHRLD